MKNVFATTENVRDFQTLAKRLEGRDDNVPGMGLIFGPPGLGKTKTAMWYAAKSGAIYIRAKAAMTVRWLLREIVEGLDEAPHWRTSDLYTQARDQLRMRPRLVIIDEVDHLTGDRQVIETVRDLHDESRAGFLLIGMHESERRLKRFQHLYDRVRAHVMQFRPIAGHDLADIAKQLCDTELADSALAYIMEMSQGKFREIVIQFYQAEYVARQNGIKLVEARHLRNGARGQGKTGVRGQGSGVSVAAPLRSSESAAGEQVAVAAGGAA